MTASDAPSGRATAAPVLRYASPAGRWVVATTVLGSGVAAIDATVVGIALPVIGRDFHAGLATLQWVVTGYTLVLAGLLLFGGALGDRYGRRRIFLVGVTWFALASLLCGLAPSAGVLVAARALQGVGAAMLMPGSLAILEASFAPADRGKAIGAWSGLSGVATAVGPFVGGWLIQAASWRLIFVINLPVAVAVLLLGWRHVPESRDVEAGTRMDLPGAALVTLGLVGLTFGLIEGPAGGWAAPSLVALAAAAVLIGGFVVWERRAGTPMLPLDLFASVQFTAGNVVTFVMYGALGGVLFLLPMTLQQVAGYSPLQAGLSLLPLTAIMLALSARSGALAARIGPRLQMSVGPVLAGAGLALFIRIGTGPGGSYLTHVMPAVVVLGLGLATTVAPLTATVLSAVPTRHAGMASAVNNDVARAAGLIAVAVLPAAAGIATGSGLQPQRLAAGFHTAALICATLCGLAGAIAAATVRNPRRRPEPGAAAAPPVRLHCDLSAPPRAEAR